MTGKEDILEDMVIRRLGAEEPVSELTLLLNKAYKQLGDMGLKYVATWQGDEITRKRIKDAECYVVLIDGKTVATISLQDPSYGKGAGWYEREDVAHFNQFAVEPSRQGYGIGSRLLEFTENRAREMGAKELALDTAEPAEHLIRFYEKRGYRFIEYVDWDVTNYRSVIMSKTL